MECRYCKWRDGNHAKKCPDLAPEGSIERRLYMAAWQGGYNDGRAGKQARFVTPSTVEGCEAQKPVEIAYCLGYRLGESALESAENGHQAWGYTTT